MVSTLHMSTVATLKEMGFDESKAERAVAAVGENLESAMDWIIRNQDQPEAQVDHTIEAFNFSCSSINVLAFGMPSCFAP